MIVQLTPSWILTDEHSASSYGQPVLVNMSSGEAFGPGDLVQAYPSWDCTPAATAVQRMCKDLGRFSDEQRDTILDFVSLRP
jgi:hypothetical protein